MRIATWSIAILPLLANCSQADMIGLRYESFAATSVGRTMAYGVLLPAAYESPDRSYPAVYLLHGLGGNYLQWIDWGVADGPWRDEFIIVLADVGNSWCFNWEDHASGEANRWEDYIVEELPAAVESAYRIDRQRCAIVGYSMGGYGAATIAMRHPRRYAVAVVLAGALTLPADLKRMLLAGEDIQIPHRERLSRDDDMRLRAPDFDSQEERTPHSRLPEATAFYDAHDPFKLVDRLSPQGSPYWIVACGRDDPSIDISRRFAVQLSKRAVSVEFIEARGGHDRRFLRSITPKVMRRIAEVLRS